MAFFILVGEKRFSGEANEKVRKQAGDEMTKAVLKTQG